MLKLETYGMKCLNMIIESPGSMLEISFMKRCLFYLTQTKREIKCLGSSATLIIFNLSRDKIIISYELSVLTMYPFMTEENKPEIQRISVVEQHPDVDLSRTF